MRHSNWQNATMDYFFHGLMLARVLVDEEEIDNKADDGETEGNDGLKTCHVCKMQIIAERAELIPPEIPQSMIR